MILAAGILLAACSTRRTADVAEPPVDDGMAGVIRGIVLDSLIGGGRRAGETLVVRDDAATASVLRAAGLEFVHLAHVPDVACPASAGSRDGSTPTAVGYLVEARLGPGSDSASRQLMVAKSCTFRARATPRGFVESGVWEIRIRQGRWVVGRTLSREIS